MYFAACNHTAVGSTVVSCYSGLVYGVSPSMGFRSHHDSVCVQFLLVWGLNPTTILHVSSCYLRGVRIPPPCCMCGVSPRVRFKSDHCSACVEYLPVWGLNPAIIPYAWNFSLCWVWIPLLFCVYGVCIFSPCLVGFLIPVSGKLQFFWIAKTHSFFQNTKHKP